MSRAARIVAPVHKQIMNTSLRVLGAFRKGRICGRKGLGRPGLERFQPKPDAGSALETRRNKYQNKKPRVSVEAREARPTPPGFSVSRKLCSRPNGAALDRAEAEPFAFRSPPQFLGGVGGVFGFGFFAAGAAGVAGAGGGATTGAASLLAAAVEAGSERPLSAASGGAATAWSAP